MLVDVMSELYFYECKICGKELYIESMVEADALKLLICQKRGK